MEAATQEDPWYGYDNRSHVTQSYLVIDTLGDAKPAIIIVYFGVLDRHEAENAIWAYAAEHELSLDAHQIWLEDRRYYFAIKPTAWAIKDRIEPLKSRAPVTVISLQERGRLMKVGEEM